MAAPTLWQNSMTLATPVVLTSMAFSSDASKFTSPALCTTASRLPALNGFASSPSRPALVMSPGTTTIFSSMYRSNLSPRCWRSGANTGESRISRRKRPTLLRRSPRISKYTRSISGCHRSRIARNTLPRNPVEPVSRMRRPLSTCSSAGIAAPLRLPLLLDIRDHQRRQVQVGYLGGATELRCRHRDRFIERVGRFPSKPCRDFRLLASRCDHAPDVLPRRFAPIPHVERMHAVVRVAVAVHVDVGGVARELAFESFLELDRISGFGQASMKKLDVTRMMLGMKFVAQRMTDDHRAAFAHQRLVPIHIEQVAEASALHEHRIHDRVDVVRTDVRHAHNQNIGLTLHRHRVLLEHSRERLLMHRLGVSRPHADHSIGGSVIVQHSAPRLARHVPHRPLKAFQPCAIPIGEVIFVLVQEVEHPAVHPRIHRRLDLKNVDRLVNQLAHPVR